MTNEEMEAIRARDAADYPAAEVLRKLAGVAGNGDPEMQATIDMIADRRALLAAYDALAAAARKVCCGRCGLFPDEQSHDECTADCPDCADLRKILEGWR